MATYVYDGNSLRVVKVVGADRTFYIYAGTQLITEYEDAASNTYNPGTTAGQAPADSVSTVLYQHADHLTTRLTTDNQGNLSNQQAHYPFGESWYNTGTADPSVLRKFTSYLKDTETGAGQLNYATFREHSARIGRFHMADPLHGRRGNPQRLNRYAYVSNDPTNRVDPRGLQEGEVCGGGYCIMQDEYNMGYAWSQDELAGEYNRRPVVTWDAWSPGGGGFLDPWPPEDWLGGGGLGPTPPFIPGGGSPWSVSSWVEDLFSVLPSGYEECLKTGPSMLFARCNYLYACPSAKVGVLSYTFYDFERLFLIQCGRNVFLKSCLTPNEFKFFMPVRRLPPTHSGGGYTEVDCNARR